MPITAEKVEQTMSDLSEREEAGREDVEALVELGFEPEAAEAFFAGDPTLAVVGKGVILAGALFGVTTEDGEST